VCLAAAAWPSRWQLQTSRPTVSSAARARVCPWTLTSTQSAAQVGACGSLRRSDHVEAETFKQAPHAKTRREMRELYRSAHALGQNSNISNLVFNLMNSVCTRGGRQKSVCSASAHKREWNRACVQTLWCACRCALVLSHKKCTSTRPWVR
jgi:hypothetical protein